MEKYLRVNLLGPDPRLMRKRIYRVAVSQTLRNTGLHRQVRLTGCESIPFSSLPCNAVSIQFCCDYVFRQKSRTLLSSSRADPYSITTLTRSPPKAAATLKPEPTQHNSLDRLQITKWKSKTLLFMSTATLKGQTVGGDNIPVVSLSV